MPAVVHLDLSKVLTSADRFTYRWVELPTSVRTTAAFEDWLRSKQLGGQLNGNNLRFLRAGGIVIDTACLIGDLIQVVVGTSDEVTTHRAAQEAAGQAYASRQTGGSGTGEQRPQASQSDAAAAEAAAESAQGQESAATAAAAVATAEGSPGEDAAAWRAFRLLSRPERLLAAERLSVEERAVVKAAGVPEEAMEDGRVLPALQRLGGHGPPVEVGHNRRCGHCGVLKPRVMYFEFMWKQPVHRSVCSHCETHLKCSTCPDHCCIKRPGAFSKRQARWWGGDRRCKECISVAEKAAAAGRKTAGTSPAAVPAPPAPEAPPPARVVTAGEAAGAAPEQKAAEQKATEQKAEQAVAEQIAEQVAAEQAVKEAAEKVAAGAAAEQKAAEQKTAEQAAEQAAEQTVAKQAAVEQAVKETAEKVAAGAAAEQKAAEQNSAEKMAAEEMLQLQVQWGETAAAQKAAVEKAAAAEEEAADSSDEMEGADADFGQPHVVSTSVVPEAERRAAVAAEADAEQERQHSIREAGGLLAGDKLVFRHPADDTELVGRRMPGNLKSLGTEHSFQPESTCVTQQEWLPSSGELVVVAGAADGAGWLVAADGGRVPGAWAFRGEHLSRVFELGVLGTIWDVDSDEEEVPVEAFHWPSPVDLDHGDGWFQKDELMGTISSHRKVRVVAVEKYARGGEMLLVEDAEEVEHDEETDFDVDLDFDQGRSNTDGDPLDEEPDGTAGSSDGCVVEMAAADGNIFRMVKRSSVWIRKSSWDTLPLQ
jgi:hypothetical protein